MIEKILDMGTLSGEDDNPTMGYQIEILWHEGEIEHRETFNGYDVKDVKSRAMTFIINHYKKLQP